MRYDIFNDTLSKKFGILTVYYIPGKNNIADIPCRAELMAKEYIGLVDTNEFEGSSKKQYNRVVKTAEHYLLDNDNKIWYANNDERNFNKLVPPIKERISLVKTSHLLGHFAFEKTYHDISSEYFWKGMSRDIKFMSLIIVSLILPLSNHLNGY